MMKIKPSENLRGKIFYQQKNSQSMVLAIKEDKTKNETAKILVMCDYRKCSCLEVI